MLKIQNLTKTYKGSGKGVIDLSIDLSAGDIYGFIGHNGAGKTTKLKCIAGILDFKDGDILIDGHSVKKEPLPAEPFQQGPPAGRIRQDGFFFFCAHKCSIWHS